MARILNRPVVRLLLRSQTAIRTDGGKPCPRIPPKRAVYFRSLLGGLLPLFPARQQSDISLTIHLNGALDGGRVR